MPGATAWSTAAGRYQRGTKLSTVPRSIIERTRSATSSGSRTVWRSSGCFRSPACGKPSVSMKPGLTVCTSTPRGASSSVSAREKASWACFDAEYGPPTEWATVPRHRDDVDDVRRPRGLERGQERARRPDRAQVVDPDGPLDQLGLGAQEGRPAGDARPVDEQADRRMPADDPRGDRVDGLAVGDVAELPLGAQFVGRSAQALLPAREQDASPPARSEQARSRGADAARATGQNGNAHARAVSRSAE